MKQLGFHLSLFVLLFIIVVAKAIPTQLYNDPAFLDAEIRRIRAGKAGEPIKPPVIKGRRDNSDLAETLAVADGTNESSGSGDENEDEDDYSDEIEVTCATGKGWHFRGQRCVPYHCAGGSSERDFNTGLCLHSFQPAGRHKPYSHWNSLNHVYRTHPAQRHISRGMLSLLRRG